MLSCSGCGVLVEAETFEFYFLEINEKIQVEYPVTEVITGIDLIEQQLLVAEGLLLGIKQSDVTITGHAIEARINAEQWERDFLPSPSTVTRARWPAGENIRIDTHIESGGNVLRGLFLF